MKFEDIFNKYMLEKRFVTDLIITSWIHITTGMDYMFFIHLTKVTKNDGFLVAMHVSYEAKSIE